MPMEITGETRYAKLVLNDYTNTCNTLSIAYYTLTIYLGQRLNLTTYDFSSWSSTINSATDHIQRCSTSIKIYEIATGQETMLCGGDQRIGSPYISRTNVVDVSFMMEDGTTTRSELILHYQSNLFYAIYVCVYFRAYIYSTDVLNHIFYDQCRLWL